ncbi:MAG: protein imuA [Alphaproteobacteria bacterium]|nr:protein imuA [Alphaproteobacteria bacterium]
MAALRDRLRKPTAKWGALSFGDARVDACLPAGGLPLGQLHEMGAAGLEAETGALTAGFVAGLLARLPAGRPILWIAPSDDLHPPGLLAYGLDPGRLVLVRPRDDAGTLGTMETALRAGGLAAVVGEVGRLERTASRRLQFACLGSGITGFALRRWPHGRKRADREATAAATRWQLAPAPSELDAREPGAPRWRVALTHARSGRPGAWILELPMKEVENDPPHPFRVVAELADYTAEPSLRARAG